MRMPHQQPMTLHQRIDNLYDKAVDKILLGLRRVVGDDYSRSSVKDFNGVVRSTLYRDKLNIRKIRKEMGDLL